MLGKTSSEGSNAIAKEYIESILAASRGGFKGGCGASLRIDPEEIHIAKEVNHVFTVLNVGNRDINFGITGIPQCLLPEPKVGELKTGTSVNITLWRTYYPVSSDSFTFMIDDNFDNHTPVKVFGAANLPSPGELAATLRSRIGQTPTLEDALAFVNPKTVKPTAGAYVAASAVLSGTGNSRDALRAIEMAEHIDPQVKNDASIQLESGVLHLTTGDSEGALVRFRAAESAPDPRISDASRWFSGVTLLSSGQSDQAVTYLCGKDGSAYPEGITALLSKKYVSEFHTLERARTSQDCEGGLASYRFPPDFGGHVMTPEHHEQ